MREVRVLVRVQVDECDPDAKIDPEIMEEAAVEAVENAIRFAEDNGFSHTWADDLSIGFVDAVLYEEDEDDMDGLPTTPKLERERLRVGGRRRHRVSRRRRDNPATGPVWKLEEVREPTDDNYGEWRRLFP